MKEWIQLGKTYLKQFRPDIRNFAYKGVHVPAHRILAASASNFFTFVSAAFMTAFSPGKGSG
jgi:hypothetical protein